MKKLDPVFRTASLCYVLQPLVTPTIAKCPKAATILGHLLAGASVGRRYGYGLDPKRPDGNGNGVRRGRKIFPGIFSKLKI